MEGLFAVSVCRSMLSLAENSGLDVTPAYAWLTVSRGSPMIYDRPMWLQKRSACSIQGAAIAVGT